MAEEAAQSTSANGQEASTVTVLPPVDSTGKFVPDWKNSLPEELRSEKSLDTFSDLTGAMKMLVNSQKLIGRKGVIVPGEAATPDEQTAFFNAIGRPKTADGYQIEVPKEMAQFYPKETLAQAINVFHGAGLTQKQVDAVLAVDMQRTKAGLALQESAQKVEFEKAESTLRAKWGSDYDTRLHAANQMIEHNTDAKTKPELIKAIGNNPVIADFLATIAGKFSEAGGINPDADRASAGGVQDAIKQLRETPGYGNGQLRRTNPAEADRIAAQLDALYARAYPEKGSR
jgi:hypothetical protein